MTDIREPLTPPSYLTGRLTRFSPHGATEEARLSRCEGKEAFSSWWAADRVRRRARKRWLQVYRCRNCQQWHLGADRSPHGKV